jgi:lipopolysaccharide/colanic/teichoic acid biosynthesis glycosyltransferase
MIPQLHRRSMPRDVRHDSEAQRARDASPASARDAHGNGFAADSPLECGVAPLADVHPRNEWYFPIKSAADFVLATLLLIVLAPVILIAGALVKLTSRGPIFYCQVRLGKDGRAFTLHKLRTMVDKAEAKTGPVWSSKDDARVTWLGRILRTTHIDEFPQLWNVICGQMSLVGPRPERPEIVAGLDWEIPCYRERLRVRPGITGLAQVRLPPDTDIESVRRKIVHDVYYVRNMSPWLDVQLLFATAWSFVWQLAWYPWAWIALPSAEAVEQGFLQAINSSELGVETPDSIKVPALK